jgi:RNA polymerase sigma-70 factor (ECF subfamily)
VVPLFWNLVCTLGTPLRGFEFFLGGQAVNSTTVESSRSDEVLLDLARRGDKEACGALLAQHWHKSVALARLFLRDRGDAEDEVQNAFSKAYAHIDQYHQGGAEFGGWLARIVANQCLMLIRSKRRTRFVYLDEAANRESAAPKELAAGGPDPEGELAFQQMKVVVRTEVRRIPPMLRSVLLLRDIKELPIVDVAAHLGITVPAAKSRLLRARRELRLRLTQHSNKSGELWHMSRSAAPLSRVAHNRSDVFVAG